MASGRRIDKDRTRWVACDKCGDWVVFENSGLVCDFDKVEKLAVVFVCRACVLERRVDLLEKERLELLSKLSQVLDKLALIEDSNVRLEATQIGHRIWFQDLDVSSRIDLLEGSKVRLEAGLIEHEILLNDLVDRVDKSVVGGSDSLEDLTVRSECCSVVESCVEQDVVSLLDNSLDDEEDSVLDSVDSQVKDRKVICVGDSNMARLERCILETVEVEGSVEVSSCRGGTIEVVENRLLQLVGTSSEEEELMVVVHAGTNNVGSDGTEDILDQFRGLIRKVRILKADTKVVLTSIASRRDKGSFVWSRSEAINNRLRSLCVEEGAVFLDSREELFSCNDFHGLAYDRVHMSQLGSRVVGRLIGDEIGAFLGGQYQ